MTDAKTRGYNDMQDHLAALDAAGLLTTIAAPIDKDSELSPLVRWQFRGGIPEAERKAFLFTNVKGGDGRVFDIPVAVGALAGNAAIYAIGMGPRWPVSAIAGPARSPTRLPLSWSRIRPVRTSCSRARI